MLSNERRAALLAYCKLTEFGDDQEVQALLETFYSAAEGYMMQAGISPPPEGTPRRAQYDLCVNYLTLDFWDRRDMSIVSTVITDNPAFRWMIMQLKLTEGRNLCAEKSERR